MTKLMDHVAFLSQEIGPRPAGTEEEQQAALYIAEQIQKDANLPASIEDFNSMSNAKMPWIICCGITFLCGILSIFLPVVAVPAIIITAIMALLLVLEIIDRPVISRMMSRGVSQNIVAKYEPSAATSSTSRRRKVILVARYDSGKATAEYKSSLVRVLPIVYKVILGGMVLVPFVLLFQTVFFPHAVGILAIILNVLLAIGLIAVFIPIVFAVLHQIAKYNEAANSNASGVAVLLEVAERLGKGTADGYAGGEAPHMGATIHGEQEARARGVVPEGVDLVYGTESSEGQEQGSEDRLSAAKAAVAALSGRPVSQTRDFAIADKLVQVKDVPLGSPTQEDYQEVRSETRDALAGGFGQEAAPEEAVIIEAAVPQEPEQVAETIISTTTPDSVPDWFKKGQEQAKKSESPDKSSVHRSRYADALDAAISDSSSQFAQANNVVNNRVEEQLQRMRDGIMEVQAPQTTRQETGDQGQTASLPPVQPTEQSETQSQVVAQPASMPAEVPSEASVQPAPADDLGSTTAMKPINIDDLKAEQQADQGRTPVVEEKPTPASISFEVPEVPEVADVAEKEARKPITLPDIGLTGPISAPSPEAMKQRAPLAQAEESSTDAAKSLLNMLPSIDVGADGLEASSEEKSGQGVTLDAEGLPSPDFGKGAKQAGDVEAANEPVLSPGATGAFAGAGATGSFSPVSDELIESSDPDELYIDDADDSVYDEGFTETGAFAGPGYVDMPKSRVRRFFDRFGGKNKEDSESSTQEWLNVDDDFEAHSVGQARGGWESFRQDEEEYLEEEVFDDNDGFADETQDDRDRDNSDGKWEGGAFSLKRKKTKNVSDDDIIDFSDGMEEASPEYVEHAYGSAASSSESLLDDSSRSRQTSDYDRERESVYQFRYGNIDTEVWLVALGSELAGNAGMRAFVSEHEQELRGSVIINLDALGAGELTYVDKEGLFRQQTASSRMKRYVRKASQALGISVPSDKIVWRDSSATYASSKGLQAMSLVGMKDGKPAYFAEQDDVLENIDEGLLEQNTNFVMEILKNI